MNSNQNYSPQRIGFYPFKLFGLKARNKVLWGCWFILMLALEALVFMDVVEARIQTNVAEKEYSNLGAGQLYFQAKDGQKNQALSLNSDVQMSINGIINRVTVTQVFKNTASEWQQGIYVFPLPEDSSVDRLTIRIGDRIIKGEIQLKEIAEKKYKTALKAGKKASVVHQNRANLFTTKIANIAPEEEVLVEIGYLQKVHIDGAVFSVRFPMTITPRYSPAGSRNKSIKGIERESEKVVKSLGLLSSFKLSSHEFPNSNTASIDINLNSGFPLNSVNSPSHKVLINNGLIDTQTNKRPLLGNKPLQINLAAGRVNMDQDFVLEWTPIMASTPGVSFFSEKWGGEYFGLLMVMPGELRSVADVESAYSDDHSALTGRELIFVIDTSGSMGGASIKQAKAALNYALFRLRPSDRFNIIEFNSKARGLFEKSQHASRSNLNLARRFSDSLTSNGGTNILGALELMFSSTSNDYSLENQRLSVGKQKQFVFLTDGSVSNESALFSLIKDRIYQSRLFTIGIGSAPNSYFMRKAAEFGRGSFTHIASTKEVERKIVNLFKKIEAPQLVNVDLIADSNADLKIYPAVIPDLYSDQPLVVSMKSSTPFSDFRLQGQIGGLEWEKEVITKAGKHGGIASLYGRARIESLEDGRHISGHKEVFTDEIKAAALFHKLVSRYTSLIAVEESVSRPKVEDIKSTRIKNLLPQGSNMKGASENNVPASLITMGYPRTASKGFEYLQRSSLLFGFALLLFLVSFFRKKGGLLRETNK